MSTTPATYDLTVLQYATFKMTLALSDASGSAIDVSGWTLGVVGEGVATMTVEVASATDGQLSINLPATETAKLIKPKYFYDIIAKNAATTPTEVYRLLQGKVSVNLGVTDI
jgi:hypothetical protein